MLETILLNSSNDVFASTARRLWHNSSLTSRVKIQQHPQPYTPAQITGLQLICLIQCRDTIADTFRVFPYIFNRRLRRENLLPLRQTYHKTRPSYRSMSSDAENYHQLVSEDYYQWQPDEDPYIPSMLE
jgi:hypothetical protein